MKHLSGVIAIAAMLTFAGGISATPAVAESAGPVSAANALETNHGASTTDVSARRRHWRYHRARAWPHVYPYGYGYYRPRPVVYPYAYSYYRPRPIYYRPYYAPAPFFSVGFGPRYYW